MADTRRSNARRRNPAVRIVADSIKNASIFRELGQMERRWLPTELPGLPHLDPRACKHLIRGIGRRSDDPEPSAEALAHFVKIYRDRIYFQPLPLFDPQCLKDRLHLFPYYLRWSFLALALHFSTHEFYSGNESEATALYMTSARGVVQELSTQGVVKTEVLQSLCLLALCEILDCEYARSWMTIGAASRLESLRLSQSRHLPSAPNSDAISRCHWSIFVLETMFTPSLVLPARKPGRPKFPSSPNAPAPVASLTVASSHSHCPDLSSNVQHDGSSPDLGINANTLQLISIWGDIVAYLQDVRHGLSDMPWLNTSRHAKLEVSFYEFEVRVSSLHMLRHASFPDRLMAEIDAKREYWMPWLTMEILHHASKAALHNPFVQLFALRGSNAKTQPGSYLQKAIDQALFNYEWVARIIQMIQGASFELYDPLIGSAVAATATIPWIFQFARDEAVAVKAGQNLELFETFLDGLSLRWPHLGIKLQTLRELRSQSRSEEEGGAKSTTIRFQPDLVWRLLCAGFPPEMGAPDESSTTGHGHANATLHVTTQYVHPLMDPPPRRPMDDSNMEIFFDASFDGFDGQFPEGFFSQTLLGGGF
ncbi:Transcription factor, fungi, partial [Metarhizium hybridum]